MWRRARLATTLGARRRGWCGEFVTWYEFFAGGGMARLGLGEGWECRLANEWSAKKAASYARRFGGDELRVCDVASLTAADLPGAADLAWASFPCQDLSL